MALVRFGGGVSEIRGSIAGNVFSKNRGGSYIRNKTNPINPPSAEQAAWRSKFAGIMAAFSLLDTSKQDAWRALAETLTRKNKIGDDYTPSGIQIFMENNLNCEAAGLALPTSAPIAEPETAPVVDSASYVAESSGGELDALTATLSSIGAFGTGYCLEASAPFASRKSSTTVTYKQVGNGTSFSAQSILVRYSALWTATAPVGSYIWFRARAVDPAGFGGPWLYTLVEVEAGGD